MNRVPDSGGFVPPPEADVDRLRTVPVETRVSRVSAESFAGSPRAGGSFRDFLEALPGLLEAESLRAVAAGIASAALKGAGVLWMMGGHVVKTGLAPVLIRMMERGAVSFLAGNGSVAVHDYEIARWGATSEDVEAGLADGSFGMAEETGREVNQALLQGAERGMGFGEALGWSLAGRAHLRAPERSLLLQAYLHGIPFGVHAAVGCDIVHQHPSADGAALGACSMRDFRRLAQWLPALDDGGVVLNLGSAVIMPEVFVKALSMARNLHGGRPGSFLAADFDMIRHYRPWMNVVVRPARSGGGAGYRLTGHHEIMIPLLAWAVEEALTDSLGAGSTSDPGGGFPPGPDTVP